MAESEEGISTLRIDAWHVSFPLHVVCDMLVDCLLVELDVERVEFDYFCEWNYLLVASIYSVSYQLESLVE